MNKYRNYGTRARMVSFCCYAVKLRKSVGKGFVCSKCGYIFEGVENLIK